MPNLQNSNNPLNIDDLISYTNLNNVKNESDIKPVDNETNNSNEQEPTLTTNEVKNNYLIEIDKLNIKLNELYAENLVYKKENKKIINISSFFIILSIFVLIFFPNIFSYYKSNNTSFTSTDETAVISVSTDLSENSTTNHNNLIERLNIIEQIQAHESISSEHNTKITEINHENEILNAKQKLIENEIKLLNLEIEKKKANTLLNHLK